MSKNQSQGPKVAVLGGGAAGFFAAIQAAENFPDAQITIFEKSSKVLSKVKVSGGGRCNVTNACSSISDLSKAYPRGGKQLKKLFQVFDNQDFISWLGEKSIELKIEENGHVFPESNSSKTIIDFFLAEVKRLGIEIRLGKSVLALIEKNGKYEIQFFDGSNEFQVEKIIIATGGSPRIEGLNWLKALGHKIIHPVPSLFTFNIPDNPIKELMGVVADKAFIHVQGTKLKSTGPLLITHWGMSGPAILKLSAFGARVLNGLNYDFKVQVNWVNELNQEVVKQVLSETFSSNPQKNIKSLKSFGLVQRLWDFLVQKAGISPDKKCGEIGSKGMNRLVHTLCEDVYEVKGKTTFKEEFVTAGGVSLESVNMRTMESKVCPGLYFAGEVLDIDGITGGYNFQAAWTTGYVASKLQ